ncbi:hypothetical protein DIE23_16625 [Burkholderia sp. Bp9143]|uniref:hypothetical protein n=1 Tax=Burkholderia sp. Bp9143 TaxID=2184574 RepID=UPI000F5A5456|nr:hypothetical protein [Burkholderia sp. Bp9143]RQR32075.1 hypothetical protein DIE23_16625 [Burkholderia sp. Bp9143]
MADSSSTRLDAFDIDAVVHRMQQHPGNIVFEQHASILEVEVPCCHYKGVRFNVRFDLAYGMFVDRVGKLPGEDISEIVGWLMKEAG